MNLTSRRVGLTNVIAVNTQRIDASVAIQFKDQMREITRSGHGRFVLDLSPVTFIDSSGLGAVVGAMKQLDAQQTLELAGMNDAVRKVFELTRMNSVFTIHPDLDIALQSRAG
ncbi:STAS domain-containing protein [Pseudoprimorskyibacter insulae]|uniref:Anti-sigma factor antagonist n=1 Tax=Pseudoprimorskyibacter insulae TaxID=1695997 RepID=A0A2R8AV11_9RHOB|nr:STAS domain-containing protein [Pseudoprimorskyibacter insulae]SPF79885.1 Anti-sigma-B factor antagonist [Pseudoprimorskyibacter insulae]